MVCSGLNHKQSHRILIAGSTGYIGRAVVKELVSKDIAVGSMVRNRVMSDITEQALKGSEILECNVMDPASINAVVESFDPTAIICCLASRSGVKRDAFAIDYQASANVMNALANLSSSSSSKRHFVLLSAYCCGKPRLQFQLAKLKLEEELRLSSSITHSIVRPTAFFKSLDGQIERARMNQPVLYFGDGSCAANPIAERDLARYLIDCAMEPMAMDMLNATRDIGGPDNPPITKLEQIDMIYNALGTSIENRKTISIPLGIFDALINTFSGLELVCKFLRIPGWEQRMNDAAELARIVQYYASEPMVAIGPGEVQGTIRLKDHFAHLAARGGELIEIDLMTTTTGVLDVFSKNQYAK
jgi:divinyl chlorophyllide a 8-vinyl-reductase